MFVNSFIVIPAASARLICQQFALFLATAAWIGATTGVMEMVIASAIDLSSGLSVLVVALYYRQSRRLLHSKSNIK